MVNVHADRGTPGIYPETWLGVRHRWSLARPTVGGLLPPRTPIGAGDNGTPDLFDLAAALLGCAAREDSRTLAEYEDISARYLCRALQVGRRIVPHGGEDAAGCAGLIRLGIEVAARYAAASWLDEPTVLRPLAASIEYLAEPERRPWLNGYDMALALCDPLYRVVSGAVQRTGIRKIILLVAATDADYHTTARRLLQFALPPRVPLPRAVFQPSERHHRGCGVHAAALRRALQLSACDPPWPRPDLTRIGELRRYLNHLRREDRHAGWMLEKIDRDAEQRRAEQEQAHRDRLRERRRAAQISVRRLARTGWDPGGAARADAYHRRATPPAPSEESRRQPTGSTVIGGRASPRMAAELRQIREHAQLSVGVLADRCQIPADHVRAIEDGRVRVDQRLVFGWLNACGVLGPRRRELMNLADTSTVTA